MKRIFTILLCLVLCVAAPMAVAQKLMSKQTDSYFSTVSMLFLYGDEDAQPAFEETWAQVKAILGEIESAVAVDEPDSDIARFNALASGERCEISAITAEILQIAMDVYAQTGGLYDPTVYPLVDLWGFSPRFNMNVYTPTLPYDRAYENGRLPMPREMHIAGLLPLVGLDGVELVCEDGAYYLVKHTPSVEIDGVTIHAQMDLGGIAKGYACDRVKALLLENGFAQGHFVCGGSSIAFLERPTPDGMYMLTIGKPRPGEGSQTHFATVLTKNAMLSSSADNNHCFVSDGVVYCHIIDPRTGWPVNMPDKSGVQKGIACVTLLSESAARSDAMTTALCVMGPLDAMAYVNDHPQGDLVMALYRSGAARLEVVTNVDEAKFTLEDTAYTKANRMSDNGRMIYTGEFFAP